MRWPTRRPTTRIRPAAVARAAGHDQRSDHQSAAPQSWGDWQRGEDYYGEAALIWLEVDTLIRERSGGKRSLDDFARAFFGVNDGSYTVSPTPSTTWRRRSTRSSRTTGRTFSARGSTAVANRRRSRASRRGGYKLVYKDSQTDYQKAMESQRGRTYLAYSLGVVIDEKVHGGTLLEVAWNSPAFRARLTEGMQILAINGLAYDADVLRDAIRAAQGTGTPIELIVKNGDRFMVVSIDYRGGLRYPRLERDASVPARLDDILTPR